LEEYVDTQRKIFDQALPLLKLNGKIVYSTCSILNQENEEQMEYFMKKYGLKIESEPLKTLPVMGGMDGFFGVVLSRINPKLK
jgi:16S rRNA (cytosine967-C5)-methyltransferase